MAETRMAPDNVAYTGDIVPEGYTQELYDFLTSVDPSFSQDLDVQQFQKALESDDNYAKSVYDFVGQHDKKFIKDVPLLDFLTSVKKKEDVVTASGLDAGLSAPQQELVTNPGVNPYGSVYGDITAEVDPRTEELEQSPYGDVYGTPSDPAEVAAENEQRQQQLAYISPEETARREAALQQEVIADYQAYEQEQADLRLAQGTVQLPPLDNVVPEDGFTQETVENLRRIYGRHGFRFEGDVANGNGEITVYSNYFGSGDSLPIEVVNGAVAPESLSELNQFLEFHKTPDMGMSPQDRSIGETAIRIQEMRRDFRQDANGKTDSHNLKYQPEGGLFAVYPTLFPKRPGSGNRNPNAWMQLNDDVAFDVAKQRDEVVYVNDEETAKNLVAGSWQDIDTMELEAERLFAAAGRDYYADRQAGLDLVEANEAYMYASGLEGGFREDDPEKVRMYSEMFIDGNMVRPDIAEYRDGLEERANMLYLQQDNEELLRLREDFDAVLDSRMRIKSARAAEVGGRARQLIDMSESASAAEFGMTVKELLEVEPETAEQYNRIAPIVTRNIEGQLARYKAAQMYEQAELYYDTKLNKAISGILVEGAYDVWMNEWGRAEQRGEAGQLLMAMHFGLGPDAEREDIIMAAGRMYEQAQQGNINTSRQYSRVTSSGTSFQWWDNARNLEAVSAVVAESLGQLFPQFTSITAPIAIAGTVGGGIIGGFAGGPAGILAGAKTGFLTVGNIGFAAGSYAMEMSNAFLDVAGEKYDLTNPTQARLAAQDAEMWKAAARRGHARGIPIAVADWLSGHLAGRFLNGSVVQSRVLRYAGLGVERAIVDPGFEMLGEAAALYNTGEWNGSMANWKEVYAEGLGSFGMSAPFALVRVASMETKKARIQKVLELMDYSNLASENVLGGRLQKWVDNMQKTGKITPEIAEFLRQGIGLRREANVLLGRNPNTPPLGKGTVVARLMELLEAKKFLEQPGQSGMFGPLLTRINEEIAKISETGQLQADGVDLSMDVSERGSDTSMEAGLVTRLQRARPAMYRIGSELVPKEMFVQALDGADTRKKLNRLSVSNDPDVALALFKKRLNAVQKRKAKTVDVGKQTDAGTVVAEEVSEGPLTQEEFDAEKENALGKGRRDAIIANIIAKRLLGEDLDALEQKFYEDNNEEITRLVTEAGVLDEVVGNSVVTTTEELKAGLNLVREDDTPLTPKQQSIARLAAKAVGSLKKNFPEVKVVLHTNRDAFMKAYREQGGTNQNTNAFYGWNKKEIHIDLTHKGTNATTVAHETFHAVLRNSVNTSEVQALMAEFSSTLKKVIDPNSKLGKSLAKFEKQYAEGAMDEEFVAQFFGELAAAYPDLKPEAKTVIGRFLERLAALMGVELDLPTDLTQRDKQILSLLERLAGQVAEGKAVTKREVETFRSLTSEAKPEEEGGVSEQRTIGYAGEQESFESIINRGLLGIGQDAEQFVKRASQIKVVSDDASLNEFLEKYEDELEELAQDWFRGTRENVRRDVAKELIAREQARRLAGDLLLDHAGLYSGDVQWMPNIKVQGVTQGVFQIVLTPLTEAQKQAILDAQNAYKSTRRHRLQYTAYESMDAMADGYFYATRGDRKMRRGTYGFSAGNHVHFIVSRTDASSSNEALYHEVLHGLLNVANNMDKAKVAEAAKILRIGLDEVDYAMTPELRQAFNNFLSGYSEGKRNEEYVVDFFAQLASGYRSMSAEARALVNRFVDAVYEIFNLKPENRRYIESSEDLGDNFNQYVQDTLNALAQKVVSGEVITEEELSRLSAETLTSAIEGGVSEQRVTVESNEDNSLTFRTEGGRLDAFPDGNVVTLDNIAVSPEAQRQGVATRLVRAVMDEFRDQQSLAVVDEDGNTIEEPSPYVIGFGTRVTPQGDAFYDSIIDEVEKFNRRNDGPPRFNEDGLPEVRVSEQMGMEEATPEWMAKAFKEAEPMLRDFFVALTEQPGVRMFLNPIGGGFFYANENKGSTELDVRTSIYMERGAVYLDLLEVFAGEKSRGAGTRFMEDFVAALDATNAESKLMAWPPKWYQQGMSDEEMQAISNRLKRFYGRFGFTPIPNSDSMTRQPGAAPVEVSQATRRVDTRRAEVLEDIADKRTKQELLGNVIAQTYEVYEDKVDPEELRSINERVDPYEDGVDAIDLMGRALTQEQIEAINDEYGGNLINEEGFAESFEDFMDSDIVDDYYDLVVEARENVGRLRNVERQVKEEDETAARRERKIGELEDKTMALEHILAVNKAEYGRTETDVYNQYEAYLEGRLDEADKEYLRSLALGIDVETGRVDNANNLYDVFSEFQEVREQRNDLENGISEQRAEQPFTTVSEQRTELSQSEIDELNSSRRIPESRNMPYRDVPSRMYHVTFAGEAIRRAGKLLASYGIATGGIGGTESVGVSFYDNIEDAELLRDELDLISRANGIDTEEEAQAFIDRLQELKGRSFQENYNLRRRVDAEVADSLREVLQLERVRVNGPVIFGADVLPANQSPEIVEVFKEDIPENTRVLRGVDKNEVRVLSNVTVREGAVSEQRSIETDGTGLDVQGTEEVIKGDISPTVLDKNSQELTDDYRLEDAVGTIESVASRAVGAARKAASGKTSYNKRNPRTKKVKKITVEYPYQNKKLLSLLNRRTNAAKKATGKKKAALMERVRETTSQILNEFVDAMTQNILAVYDTLTPEFIEASKEWYVGANRVANELAAKYNISLEQAASVLAVLSPQNDWFNNISVAERTIEVMSKHSNTPFSREIFEKALDKNKTGAWSSLLKDAFARYEGITLEQMDEQGVIPATQTVILRAIDQALYPGKVLLTDPDGRFLGFDTTPVRWGATSEIAKAIFAFRNPDIDALRMNLGYGNKVRNFYNNIADPNSTYPYVTADTHAAAVAMSAPMSADDAGGVGLFEGGFSPMYMLIKEAYINAAEIAGIKPREMQSITWEAVRVGMNDANRTAAKVKSNKAKLKTLVENQNVSPYEAARRILIDNPSANPEWATARGIQVQFPDLREGFREKAESRGRDILSLRGRTGRDVGDTGTGLGVQPSGISEQRAVDSTNGTFLIPVESDVSSVSQLGFDPKQETHVTIIGFPTGRKVMRAMKRKYPKLSDEEIANGINRLIARSDLRFTPTGRAFEIEKDYPGHTRQALIEEVEMPGLARFYGELSELIGEELAVPYPHISLGTRLDPRGIGINSVAEFEALNPKPVTLPQNITYVEQVPDPNQDFAPGTRKIIRIGGGRIEIAGNKDLDRYGIIELFVPEDQRRQGIGTQLVAAAIEEADGKLAGMASKDAAVTINYNLGMRYYKPDGTEATLEETKRQRAENSYESVFMTTPEARNAPRREGVSEQRTAPNGQPSNLNEVQYDLVRTPEFKSWFGDWEQAYRTGNYDGVSKIIDENGEPMVMYHGSIQRGITEFTEEGAQRGRTSGLREYGVSFTSVRDLAQGYAKGRAKRAFQMSPEYRPDVDVSPSVYAAFLKIDNPFVYDAKLKFFPHWMKDIPYMTLSEGLRYGKSGRAAFEAVMGGNDIYNSPYDGAVIENVNDINDTEFTYQDKPRLTESTGALVQIPFSSKPTIKLADGSNTTFSSASANISEQRTAPERPKPTAAELRKLRSPEFKAWFGDWENDPENASKVVDANGFPLKVYHAGPSEIDVFYYDRTVGGFFFSPSFEDAKRFGERYAMEKGLLVTPYVGEYYLNIRDPKVYEQFDYKFGFEPGGESYLSAVLKEETTAMMAGEPLPMGYGRRALNAKLMQQGIDGINTLQPDWYQGSDFTSNSEQWVAFYPNSIKTPDAKSFDDLSPRVSEQAMGAMSEPGDSMVDIINKGRQRLIPDAAIKAVLIKRFGRAKIDDINNAMYISMDVFRALPEEFGNVEGGVAEGRRIFDEVEAELKKFMLPKQVRITNKKQRAEIIKALRKEHPEWKDLTDTQVLRKREKIPPPIGAVRAKAKELLENNERLKKQPASIQDNLVVAFDKSLNTRANKGVQNLISQIKRDIRQRKRGEREARAVQRLMRALINESLPRAEYTKAEVARLLKIVNEVNANNYYVKADQLLNEVNKKRAQLKKNTIRDIQRLVRKAARTYKTQGGRVRTRGLDAPGQAFFAQAEAVLKAIDDADVDTIQAMVQEMGSQAHVDALNRQNEGLELTRQEQELIDRMAAFDLFSDLFESDLEYAEGVLTDLQITEGFSRTGLKQQRLANAARAKAIREEAGQDVRDNYSELVIGPDGKPLTDNQIGAKRSRIRKIWQSSPYKSRYDRLKEFSKMGAENVTQMASRTGLLTGLSTLTSILGDYYYENIYQAITVMNEEFLIGLEREIEKRDEIANSIDGIEDGFGQIARMLLSDASRTTITTKEATRDFYLDELMRIYTLSLNSVQRAKLLEQGFTDEVMAEITTALGPQLTEFAEKMTEYLSSEYYSGINRVYSELNSVNLPYVENYFPTRSLTSESVKIGDIFSNFSGYVSAQTASALKARTNVKGPIDLGSKEGGIGFIKTLDDHLHQMERFKAFAEGVRDINVIMSTPEFRSLLSTIQGEALMNLLVNQAVDPDRYISEMSKWSKAMDWLASRYTTAALFMKLFQTVKQFSSVIMAFEKYKYRPDSSGFTDLIMFSYDVAMLVPHMLAELATWGKYKGPVAEAYNASATFRKRANAARKGEIYQLESGVAKVRDPRKTYKKSREMYGALHKIGGAATSLGDIGGIMGYLVNYRRDIQNGMDEAEALKRLNSYNMTQQSRESVDRVPVQIYQDGFYRLLIAFTSTQILYLNNTVRLANKIGRDRRTGKGIKSSDLRGLALNSVFGYMAYVATANMFMLLRGDKDDRREYVKNVAYSPLGGLFAIPLIGDGFEMLYNELRGNKYPASIGVNPYERVWRNMKSDWKNKNYLGAFTRVVEWGLGINLDFGRAAIDISKGEGVDENLYQFIGVPKSQRPKGSNARQQSEPDSPP